MVPGPTDDAVITPNIISTVDAERDAASGAVSGMKTIHGRVQDAAARIKETDDPIGFMDSLSSILESLERFNSLVDKIATVGNHAMHLVQKLMDSWNH